MSEPSLRLLLRGLASFPDALPNFVPEHAPDDPVELFGQWLMDAIGSGVLGPHAATLSTVDAEGRPNSRVLILKDVDENGWQFASSAASPKGRELAANRNAALSLFWPDRGRQIRVRGSVVYAGEEIRELDFEQRSADSRLAVTVGRQSQVLDSPEDYATAVEAAEQLLDGATLLIPEEWTVYLLRAWQVEFWQAQHDRRHVRLRYQRPTPDSLWRRDLLWP